MRTPSPSTATSKPRLGLFGRRFKTTAEEAESQHREKVTRRGPVAGTGHEGYGRYAPRGRTTTNTGGQASTRDRSTSTASTKDSIRSKTTPDPFFLERMSPVVIAGGGEIVVNRNTSFEMIRNNEQNITANHSDVTAAANSLQASSSIGAGHEGNRTTIWPSANIEHTEALASQPMAPPPEGRWLSESSDNESRKHRPTIAQRRSMQRTASEGPELSQASKPPAPSRGLSPSTSSLSTTNSREDGDSSKSSISLQQGPRKLAKRPRSPRKWNFFQRSQQPQTARSTTEPHPGVPVIISKSKLAKPVAHYAMIDSEQEGSSSLDLEDIMREAEEANIYLSQKERDVLRAGGYKVNLSRDETYQEPVSLEVLDKLELNFLSDEVKTETDLPEEPVARDVPAKPEVSTHSDIESRRVQPVLEAHSQRPSRLAQVGRIPPVGRARPPHASSRSFSRPFARFSTIQPLILPALVDRQSIALGSSPRRFSAVSQFSTRISDEEPEASTATDSALHIQLAEDNIGPEHAGFLAFSPRQNSEVTTSSGSSHYSLGFATAIVPDANEALQEDEVWDEYDDLIEEDAAQVPPSATSSHGMPFQYESYESRAVVRANMPERDSPILDPAPSFQSASFGSAAVGSLAFSIPYHSVDYGIAPDGLTIPTSFCPPLPRSEDAMANTVSPTTPMSFTDFISGYGDRDSNVTTDIPPIKRRSSESHASLSLSRHSTLSSNRNSNSGRSRNSADSRLRLRTVAEQTQASHAYEVNLRVGSMTVSKWLTFGHVLFSPARDEILQSEVTAKPHSVLVIDGLGNGM